MAALAEEIKDRQRTGRKRDEKALPNGEKREDGNETRKNESRRKRQSAAMREKERRKTRRRTTRKRREKERQKRKREEKLRAGKGGRVGVAIAGSCW